MSYKWLIAGVLVGLLASSPAWSADTKKEEAKKTEAKKEAPKAEAAEKPKGRLPAHYADVVTPEQKEKIYAIQAKYDEELDKLEEQLKTARAKRQEEIEALLSKDQKAKIAELAAAAKGKKKEGAEEKTEAKPEDTKPTTKKPEAAKK